MSSDAADTDFGRFIFEREAWYRQRRADPAAPADRAIAGSGESSAGPAADPTAAADAVGNPPEIPDGSPDVTAAADAVLAHEVELARAVVDAASPDEECPDEAEANAAASHLPAPLMVYSEPGGAA